jgi:hypothetical protein
MNTAVRRNTFESETSPMNTEVRRNTFESETSENMNILSNIGGQINYYSETDTSSFSRKLRKVFNE